jgi:hypothetical protein
MVTSATSQDPPTNLAMSHDEEDWTYDDEDWTDEEEPDDSESVPCPECGATIHSVLDKCPKCGYWLTAEDRRNMWAGARKPTWLMITAWVILAVFVIPIIAIVMAIFKQAPAQNQ